MHPALFTRIVALFLIVGLISLPPSVLDARPEETPLHLIIKNVDVHYRSGDAGLAKQAAKTVDHACGRISEELGIHFNEPVKVFIVHGHEAFLKRCGGRMPEWAMAAALSAENGIVVDASPATPGTANDLHLVMIHETVHLALGTLERGRTDRLPLWFHEGLALRLSRQSLLRGSRRSYRLAAAQGTLLDFDDLETSFPEDPAQARLAYLQSEAFLAHVANARSHDAPKWILERYRNGDSFDAAFENVMGATRSDFERRWAKSLRKRFPWLHTFWELTSLFTLMAVGTIVVFIVVRLRARRQRRQWAEEERLWTVVTYEDGQEPDEEPDTDLWS